MIAGDVMPRGPRGQVHVPGVVEIFGVVADPATGQTIRAYETADRVATPPAALGARIAYKLKEHGAADLLNGSAEIPAGA